MNNSELKPLVENWLNEKYPTTNRYEPIFQVDHITGDGTDFLSIDSEQYPFMDSINASLIIELAQAFPKTEIRIVNTQDGLSIFMESKEN